MSAWHSLVLLLPLGLVLTQCRSATQATDESSSRMSSVAIGDFQPNKNLNLPDWKRLDIQMDRTKPDPNSLKRSFERKQGSEVRDQQLSVPYGTYRISLQYFDTLGKKVYESCKQELVRDHMIAQPQYKVPITICVAGTEEMIGSSVAEIEITPVLETNGSNVMPSLTSCVSSFPKGTAPSTRPVNFETEKATPYFVHQIAALAPCLVIENRCEESVLWVQSLSGALGSLTQNVRTASGTDNEVFLKNLASDTVLANSIADHAACLKQQPRGVQGFVSDYVALIKTLL